MFSKRVLSISESPIRKFTSHSLKAKAEGKRVIPLNIGQPDIQTPQAYFDAIASIEPGVIAYTPSNGIDELLEAFAAYYKKIGMPFQKEDLLITNGGSEALSFTFSCLCDFEDEVLVFEPYYTNYNTIAKVVGVKLKPIVTKPEDNFRLPPQEEMSRCVTDRTRAILVTNPNNPTGLVCTRNEIESIIKTAIDRDLFIIADEVYREFIYDDAEFVSFTEYPQVWDRLVIIDSVSKRFSACGVRIGCIASKNKEFIAQGLKLCQSRLCAPYVEQVGAAALIRSDERSIHEAASAYKRRRDVCMSHIEKMEGVSSKRPQGAFYFIVKLPIEDADDFTGWLLSDFDVDGETIMLCPAAESYATEGVGKNEVRISYCIDEKEIEKAMIILEQGLKEYQKIKNPALV
ncbi:MAG: pyridoxal phosphate-dependent aminotransferase [Anaerofustis sp.]